MDYQALRIKHDKIILDLLRKNREGMGNWQLIDASKLTRSQTWTAIVRLIRAGYIYASEPAMRPGKNGRKRLVTVYRYGQPPINQDRRFGEAQMYRQINVERARKHAAAGGLGTMLAQLHVDA